MMNKLITCFILIVLFILAGNSVFAKDYNPDTDWFKEAGYGVFVHYLYDIQNNANEIHSLGKETSWDQCVIEFDCEKFAKSMKQAGAGYVIFTMHQRTRFFIAPNQTFDKLTGYKPGQACATRDLVEDLYQALSKHGIPLMLYWTGDGPRQDKQASDGLGGWNGKVTDQYLKNWSSVVAEYSQRYGDKVAGWWVDGCYGYIGYNQQRWGILANGLRTGNPKAIIALNNPSMSHANSSTDHDDFTTGEVNTFRDIPDSRWRDGKQFHVLSFLGSSFQGWGQPGSKYKKQQLIDYIHTANKNGGVVSVDVMIFRDGSLDQSQLEILKAIRPGIEKKKREEQAWKYKKAVPAGNFACWKPSQFLSIDGKKELPVNGAGGKPRYAKYGVDGDSNTIAQASKEWPWTYQVDIVELHKLSRAIVTFGKEGYATYFEVLVSVDGKKWKTAAAKKNCKGGKIELVFDEIETRYVRIKANKPDGPNQQGGQMQIAELELY